MKKIFRFLYLLFTYRLHVCPGGQCGGYPEPTATPVITQDAHVVPDACADDGGVR